MENRMTWGALAATVVFFLYVVPALTPEALTDILPLAIWGGISSVIAGSLGALIWIVRTHGWPFGRRDVALDRSSPFLRQARRNELVLGIGLVVAGVIASAIAVGYYPNPPPPGKGRSPEEYVLGILIGGWVSIAMGTCWLVVQAFWSRVLRRAGRLREQRPTPTARP